MKKFNQAFTLIELLVVIAIVGVLSGFVFVSLTNSIGAAQDAKRKADLSQIQKALLMYQVENNGYPILSSCTIGAGCLAAQLAPYIATLPSDPDAGKHYTYASADGLSYTLQATLSSGATYAYTNTGWATGIFAGYAHYKTITLTNGSGNSLTNYPIKLSVYQATGQGSGSNCEGLCKNDFSDLAFTDSTGATALPFWLETGSLVSNTSVTVWVNVPMIATGSTTSIRMYYNATNPTFASNGDNTFPTSQGMLFDDFSGSSLDAGKWTTVTPTTLTVSGGSVYLYEAGTSTWKGIYSNSAIPVSNAIRARSRFSINGGVYETIGQDSRLYGGTNISMTYVVNNAFNISSVTSSGSQNQITGTAQETTNYHIVDLIKDGTASLTANYDGAQMNKTNTTYIPTTSEKVTLGALYGGGFYTDWILARKYASPEPTTAFGSQN
jgi:prepilin-type N-terminal cleavage/methylation domain-containing protein